MNAYKTIVPFLKEHWHNYVIGIVLLMLVDTANLLIPQVLRIFTDWAQFGELNTQRIILSVFGVVGMGAFISIGRYIWRNQLYGTAKELEYWLRDQLFLQYLSLDVDYYKHKKTGDLMAHATNDVKAVSQSMGGGIMMIIDSIFMSFLTIIMMIATVGLKTSLIALSALPFISVAIGIMAKPVQRRSRTVQNTFSELTTEVQEHLSGVRVIKATGVEKLRSTLFSGVNQKYRDKNLDLVRINGLFDPVIKLFSGISFVVFMLYGSYQIYQQNITLGDFVAVVNYLQMIIWPMVALGMIANMFQRGIASMQRLNEIYGVHSSIVESDQAVSIEQASGAVRFERVYFRYEEDQPYVLEDVSFTLEKGNNVAILGRTGSGKSTIIDLLLRFYDANSGQVLFSGVDVTTVKLRDLRGAIATVPQDSFLFSKTIADNITFSQSRKVERDTIIEAAKFAKVHEDIMAMPKGYDTLIGERGVTLSGGQKQRLCIARAYLQDAPLLVLDDSLSAVDTETEDEILQHLKELGQSLLLISQRISAVKHADHILVMDEGKIIQEGTHESLLREEGLYRTLHDHQRLESQLDQRLREGEWNREQ
ncbi:MAG TPA: ABC transporter ATP-binding protein [Eubacteriaceae bacterium]|nr:ABC transporter ATP-binding protein [Eubacteriaceae bacterium]